MQKKLARAITWLGKWVREVENLGLFARHMPDVEKWLDDSFEVLFPQQADTEQPPAKVRRVADHAIHERPEGEDISSKRHSKRRRRDQQIDKEKEMKEKDGTHHERFGAQALRKT